MPKILKNVSIHFDKNSEVPMYVQVAESLAAAIRAGELAADAKLPSIRALARHLQVNTVTIVTAYRLLEQQGYVQSQQGSGTYVRPPPQQQTTRQIYVPHQGTNFASATPTPDIFPVADFKRLLNTVLDRDGGHAFGYLESQGWLPLRQALVDYLAEGGINTAVDNIHIISGAQQGIDLAAKTLINQGDEIFVESPTYYGALASFQSRGAKIIPIPLEKDGPDLGALTQKLRKHKPKLFYVMPNFQNPTGYSYSRQKKQQLLELAKQHRFFVVEDDYLSELSFSGRLHSPLRAMDGEGSVVYIKSFSKILMPGLRLGLMVTPPQLNQPLGSAKQFSDISSSGLLQRTLDLYLREHTWQKHLACMRDIYGARYQLVVKAMQQHLPEQVTYTLPGGGLHLWLKLPDAITGDELYKACLQHDVLITPGSYFTPGSRYNHYVRLSFAAVHAEEIEPGMAVIGRELETLGKPSKLQPLL